MNFIISFGFPEFVLKLSVLLCFENCVFSQKVKILNNAGVNFLLGVPLKVVTLYLVQLVADPSFASYCCVSGEGVL